MEHVEHVVEHVEVGVLSEMICWPFSWVPGLGKKIPKNSIYYAARILITWYEMHLQDLLDLLMGYLVLSSMT